MESSIPSPAKINLFLAVTGRRTDGFHDLVSVVAPLDFCDVLDAGRRQPGAGGQFSLECNDPALPVDESNMVLKAAKAFAAVTKWEGRMHFRLQKRIPVGAGFGGGSSNAVAALRKLNEWSANPLSGEQLAGVAAALGSDCPLFLHPGPVVIRGRGELVEQLPASALARLRGQRVLIFKPSFSISTAWAFARMASAAPRHYLPVAAAEARLAAWLQDEASTEELLFNNMEGAVFEKFPALPALLAKLRSEFGVAARMSGSGSACFALLRDDLVTAPLVARIRECWGPAAFVQESRLA